MEMASIPQGPGGIPRELGGLPRQLGGLPREGLEPDSVGPDSLPSPRSRSGGEAFRVLLAAYLELERRARAGDRPGPAGREVARAGQRAEPRTGEEWSAAAIARRLGRPVGEVELLLRLAKLRGTLP